MRFGVWDRVISTFMTGVAPADSGYGQTNAGKDAMGLDRSLGVDRARRLISTLSGPVWRDRQLVEPDQQEG